MINQSNIVGVVVGLVIAFSVSMSYIVYKLTELDHLMEIRKTASYKTNKRVTQLERSMEPDPQPDLASVVRELSTNTKALTEVLDGVMKPLVRTEAQLSDLEIRSNGLRIQPTPINYKRRD